MSARRVVLLPAAVLAATAGWGLSIGSSAVTEASVQVAAAAPTQPRASAVIRADIPPPPSPRPLPRRRPLPPWLLPPRRRPQRSPSRG